eukprot:972240-Pyramimonas_sp.AAC.1
MRGIGWVAFFSVYIRTGRPVTWAAKAAVLDTFVDRVMKLRIPWFIMGDFIIEPRSIGDSPWNQEAKGHVIAWFGEGGTCKFKSTKQTIECFIDRVIAFFWMDARMAGVFDDVLSFETMPYRPHRPTWLRANKPWTAYNI